MNTQQFVKRWSTLVVLGTTVTTAFEGVASAQTDVRPGQRYAQLEDERIRVRVVGVVTRALDDDEFRLRADDGKTYRVSVRRADNTRVVVGDRVEVTGRMDGNTIIARRITQIGINPGGGGSLTVQRGVVVSNTNDTTLEIRADDGRFYRIRSRAGNLGRFRMGDRIEARGYFDADRIFVADSVVLQGSGDGTGDRFTQRGTIINIIDAAVFEMRGEDGVVYRIQAPFRGQRSTSPVVRVGDRVQVRGYFDRDRILIAESVQLIGSGGNGDTGERVTRRGTIVNIVDAAVFEMQGEDGVAYRVQAPFRGQRTTAPVVRIGDRVEVRGYFDPDRIIVAENVRLLNRDNNGDVGDRVTRRGTVVNIVSSTLFDMNGDDGVAYRVRMPYRNDRAAVRAVRVGDRLEVRGAFDADRIIVADNIQFIGGSDPGTPGDSLTRRGTVVNIVDASTFEMQGEDGIAYRMRTPYGSANRVNIGDRVEVHGYFDADRILITDNVRIIGRGDTGGNIGERVTRRGVVVNLVDNNTFEMRGDDGANYRMRTRNNEARRVNINDRVEVRGYFDPDRIIITDSVQVIGRGTGTIGGGSEGPDGSQANFTGTVLRADRLLNIWILQVNTDDGRRYQVSYSGNTNFAANDRVRVVGTFRRGSVVANTVTRL